MEKWNALRTHIDTQKELNSIWYTQDTANLQVRKEKEFIDNASPLFQELDSQIRQILLEHPDRTSLDKHYGQRFLQLIALEETTFSPKISSLLQEESKLKTAYTDLTSSAKIPFRGAEYNLSTLEPFFSDKDRTTRHEAHKAKDRFYHEHAHTLDSLYSDLVTLRTRKAKTLDYPSYVPLAYSLMARTDYGPKEVAAFREEVRQHLVPLIAKWHDKQRRDLSLDTLMFWDEPVLDLAPVPKPSVDHDTLLKHASIMFKELSPQTDEFFTTMRSRHLHDLQARSNKAPGGYCTYLADFKAPFIFSNFNGTLGDVTVFTHECGHALNSYLSTASHIPEYRWPTTEACEIHSIALEFLTWPWMELFFDKDASRFRKQHLLEYLFFFPYACAVDAFQHTVYENPTQSPHERHACWKDLERQFLPWRNYGDLPYWSSGAFWQAKLHIYLHPFYYIDYALALTCALQLWHRAITQSKEEAMRDYLALCTPGGSLSFTELLKAGRLDNPFEPGVLSRIVRFADAYLAG